MIGNLSSEYPHLITVGREVAAAALRLVSSGEQEERGEWKQDEILEEGALHLFFHKNLANGKSYSFSVRFPFTAGMNGTFYPQKGEVILVPQSDCIGLSVKPMTAELKIIWRSNRKSCIFHLGEVRPYHHSRDRGTMWIR